MPTAPGPFSCPVCGAEVPWNSKSCPECGACDKSGWSGETQHDHALPERDFDYDAFVSKEFGHPPKRSVRDVVFWLAAVLVLIAFLLTVFR